MHWATDAWQADRDPLTPLEAVNGKPHLRAGHRPFQGVPNLGAQSLFASSAQAYVILAIAPWAERRQSGVSLTRRAWIKNRRTRAERMLPPSCPPAFPIAPAPGGNGLRNPHPGFAARGHKD